MAEAKAKVTGRKRAMVKSVAKLPVRGALKTGRGIKKVAKKVQKTFSPKIEIPVNDENATDNFNALESFSSAIQQELNSLGNPKASIVAKHLASAIEFLEENPEESYNIAKKALESGSRLAFVREIVGLAAYNCGEWKKAIAEFRTAHRINGSNTYIPNIADCFRALGQYEKVFEIVHTVNAHSLDPETNVELKIIEAGAYSDLKQFDKAHEIVSKEYSSKRIPFECSLRLAEAKAYFYELQNKPEQAEKIYEIINQQNIDVPNKTKYEEYIVIETTESED